MPEISQPTQKLISRYQNWYQSQQPKTGVPTIHVDEVASAVASFYEKIRGVVEWKEEHLLRKAAIERILKRRLILKKNGGAVAESFVLEMIRGGHFPNDQIQETKIKEVQIALNKYLYILQNSGRKPYILENSAQKPEEKLKPSTRAELGAGPVPHRNKVSGAGVQLYDWLLGIAACEIEEILCSHLKEKSLIGYMTEMMKERIKMAGVILDRREIESQIFIACQKALFKFDSSMITYYLLRNRYPQWSDLPENLLKEIATNIYSIWKSIEKDLNHPLAEKFYKICEQYDTPYLILGDVVSQNPSEIHKSLSEPETFEASIKQAYQVRLGRLKSRMARAAFYSTISIFVTKMLLAFAIEVPFDRYVLGKFNYETIGINILIPPLLMFLLVLTIKPPRKENLNVVIIETMKIVYSKRHDARYMEHSAPYKKDVKDVYEIKFPRKKGFILNSIIALFYFFTFIISFGAIIWALNRLNFGVLSIIIFLMFFSLIAFAGVKIRERAKELQVIPQKAGFFTFLLDSFSLPFLRVGRWLSGQWMKYNIILVLIIALIDMPFQVFVEFLEQWRSFLKEKKGEIH